MQLNALKDSLFDTISRQTEKWTGVVTGAPEAVRLVVAATNNEHWGPTGQQMRQIADLTFKYQECTLVLQTVWDRLSMDTTSGANWRNIYKTLLLLDYLIKNGSERVVNDARQTTIHVKTLTSMHHVDGEGVDRGISIRERSKHIVDLLGDTYRLRDERKKSKQNRDKYNTAYGSESVDFPSNNNNRYGNRSNGWDDDDWRNKRNTSGGYVDDDEDDYDNNNKKPSLDDDNDDFDEFTNKSTVNDEFNDFVKPTPQPLPTSTPLPSAVAPPPTNWDPFSNPSTVASIPATTDDWDEIDWPSSSASAASVPPAIFDPTPQIPVIPIAPGVPGISAPPALVDSSIINLFGPTPPTTGSTTGTPLKTSQPVGTVTATGVVTGTPLKTSQQSTFGPTTTTNPTPLKSSDPWAHSKLFDLDLADKSGSGPSPNKALQSSGKTLGSTVGSGWGTSSSGTSLTGYSGPTTFPPSNFSGYATGGAVTYQSGYVVPPAVYTGVTYSTTAGTIPPTAQWGF